MVFLDNNMIQSTVINMCSQGNILFLDIYRIMATIEDLECQMNPFSRFSSMYS